VYANRRTSHYRNLAAKKKRTVRISKLEDGTSSVRVVRMRLADNEGPNKTNVGVAYTVDEREYTKVVAQ